MIHSYLVERLMLGTSWLGDARVIRIRRDRSARRGPARETDTLIRWAARQWRRLEALYFPIGDVEVSVSDEHPDLFIRNQAAIRVDQRAIRIDDALRRWLELGPGPQGGFDSRAGIVEIDVPDAVQSPGKSRGGRDESAGGAL